ncbi:MULTISPECIES: DUF4190 domain-containing protein [unclassified Streptomyces]|uniref:DUF4190 domain-containing protein n=1 Tax=unclassified Streptomyces TaxID=2593676 RepID=UPI0036FBB22A
MSGTDHTRPVTEGSARPRPVTEGAARPLAGRNRAAKVSGFSALWAVASLGNFATGLAWMNPGVFVGMAVLAALIAVPAGHVGRFRGRRLGGEGRGLALAGILTGWLVLVVCALAALAYLGLVAGLAVLVDHA